MADGQYHRFDVTDGIVLSPITHHDTNPDRVWVYRHNVSDSLSRIPRYLGSIQINQKPLDATIDDLETMFDKMPLPDHTLDRAKSNCVTWTVNAIQLLAKAGYCRAFDVEKFQDFALEHADKRLADFKNESDPIRYPPNTNRWLRLF